MLGQVLRVKGYYDVMIHKHYSEDDYDLIDFRVGRSYLKGLASKWATWYPYLIPRTREQGSVVIERSILHLNHCIISVEKWLLNNLEYSFVSDLFWLVGLSSYDLSKTYKKVEEARRITEIHFSLKVLSIILLSRKTE